ncbi:hypothetical protein H257_09064 [Aphanomyces astaci]|uniref:Uncharacterized protein n=1 Tax=Aphanomyces astaci TaxID=112090 RepID=W4GE06_APHAT|nr:hypothetical protein H257_09064 [Aphanomyces astaci]ETV77178.1 hypothetical protein H257_09064 [Aphanomyces astaci]|eukprot:XP_009833484.1 hypothetical protein H257_09064 [Aphanomyces astaci]
MHHHPIAHEFSRHLISPMSHEGFAPPRGTQSHKRPTPSRPITSPITRTIWHRSATNSAGPILEPSPPWAHYTTKHISHAPTLGHASLQPTTIPWTLPHPQPTGPTATSVQDSDQHPTPLGQASVQPMETIGQAAYRATSSAKSVTHPSTKRPHSEVDPDLNLAYPSFTIPPSKRHQAMLYPPTPSYQPDPPDPTQHSQDSTDPPSHEEDLDEYDANTALQFPAVQLHVLMGRTRTTAALQCPDCGRLDHQGKPCDRFTYLDPRDRARSKSRHKSTPRGPKSPGAPPTTDLVPHLRQELSTYVDHRIVQATAPLQEEVDTLRADKEALTALVSATKRRLREATEHQQSEDQRKLTEAQNRLQTTITQQGTHQEAMAERLPIIESSLRTLIQAMQSVSSQLAGLAALGTPATRIPAAYPAQPTLTPSPSAPDGPVPLN